MLISLLRCVLISVTKNANTRYSGGKIPNEIPKKLTIRSLPTTYIFFLIKGD